ncbi:MULTISPECIES: DHA2 family efflux MFS transporter permease subunit [unclassified Caballeronia]|uniref:DHA2 family efflux MFS transporter permease subunit n=1 Tax=unclassified Caballeronia TaxID=2646786 RepID=UPI0028666A0C|nr:MULTISPECIES: DHA2 family efflux MFS transporter permease subunit [unclassified Caballeronia]MDR5754046.1 DHA2 family efflux MFS transporter permease subunit [Caballeronia sp. LZ024]MDR5840425.1 DHA2 family efflux MFS transporter permease subunit [Caballeronia sp. LZ031]
MSSEAAPASAAAPINRPMLTVSIMLATLIQTLDSTIANVALPHMQGSLSASQDEITWVLTSYIVAAAIATPLTGWLSDRLSVKRLLALSIAGFTIASAFCGLSETLAQIVGSRLLQGIFGASLVPLSQSILLDINPREKQGQAMAVWGMGVMVGPILGPTLGGWLTDSYNWRWVFFINVPIGAFALFGVLTFLPAREPKHGVKFDAFGFATLGLAIGAFQAMLDRGEQLDWFGSLEIRVEAILAAISFAFFIAHTATAGRKSFFRYELLKDRNFATGVSFIFVIGAVMYATRALLPPMLQNLMNYPVATTGLVTAPSGAGTMIAMMFAGRLLKRFDARLMLLAGFLISAFALWQMMHYTIVLSASDIVWPGVIQGFGLGLVFVPLSALSFSTLTPELRADGTATYSLMRNIGSSIGISIVQTLMTRNTQIAHADLAANVTAFNPAMQPMLANGSIYDMAVLNQSITQQAAMIAYLNDFKLMFVATLLVVPLVLLIRPAKKVPDETLAHAAMD